jgi:hypothetical protein
LINEQTDSDVVGLKDGGFVVVWQSEHQDVSGWGVYLQRFDANGNKVGAETLVNSTTERNQSNPEITSLENGGFVVVWQGDEINNIGSNDIFIKVLTLNYCASVYCMQFSYD